MFFLQNSTSTAEYFDTRNNHPHVVRLSNGNEMTMPTYHVIVEQNILVKCMDLATALFQLLEFITFSTLSIMPG